MEDHLCFLFNYKVKKLYVLALPEDLREKYGYSKTEIDAYEKAINLLELEVKENLTLLGKIQRKVKKLRKKNP